MRRRCIFNIYIHIYGVHRVRSNRCPPDWELCIYTNDIACSNGLTDGR